MSDKPLYYKYWGKARKKEDGAYEWHLLPYHCLDLAAVGSGTICTIPSERKGVKYCL
jgi:hypothetical protein